MSNLAHQFPNGFKEIRRKEKLDGVIHLMSPSACVYHGLVSLSIASIFKRHLKGKPCTPFGDGVDVFLTEDDTVIPDAMIVCNRDIIKKNGIHGAPDLIVEVLSPSTASNDKNYKKNLYERCGVKEYWIVDVHNYTVDVFHLVDGKYVLAGIYTSHEEAWLAERTQEELDAIIYTFKVSLFNDFVVDVREIFEDIDF
ncbi:MAG: Uma2 family endonuclease [Defluviitaleaceae bacterium]|nr:Uma2 family endonuclease [Defluviitaleaceae bacterium]